MSKKQSPSDQSGTHSPNFRKSTEQRFQLESLEKRELMAADLLSSLSPEPVFAESAEIAEGEASTAPVARNDAFETTQGQKLVVAEQLFAKTFDLRSEEMKTPFYSHNASMLRESFSPNVYYWQPSSLNQWAEVTYKVEVPFEIDHVDMPGLGAHHLPYMSVYNANADVNFDSGARGEVQVSVDNQNWFTLYESTPEGGRQAPNDINDIVAGHDTFYFKGRMYATRHLGCCGLSQFLRSSPERDSFPVLKIHGVAGVLQNDADPNGDRLTADLLRQPSNGQLVLNEDGFFEYTPNSGFAGLDTFSYTASDGNEKSNPATVAINVKGTNNPPTLDNIADPAPINEDAARQSVRITGISSGDTRREDLELHVSTDNPQLLTNLEVNYNQGDDFAIVSYTPAADAFGKAEVTVTVEDDGTDCKLSTRSDNLKTSQSFTVVVNPVNDLPLIDSDVIQVTIEEDSQSDLIPFTISDVETPADRLEILIESGDPVAIPPENIVITGEGNQRFVQITPDPDQHGHTHIVLTVMDEEGALAQHRIQVDISCINDAPVATDDQYSVDRDSRLIVPSRLYREVGLGVTAEHWTSVGNNENGNDFSTHTESGVIGGRFTRSAHKRILADTDLSTVLSFDQPFSASGVLEIGDINVPDFGNGMMIGHFDDGSAAEVDEVRDGPVEIGIGFTDNSQGNRIFWYGGIMDHGGLMMPATGMTEITPNSTHLWSYEWDPAGGDGNGIFKATLDGVSHIIELNEEQRKQLDQTELNAFGFAGNAASHPNGGMYADIYMKHASYTSGQQKGVLENDYDVDLDPLESKLVSQPEHGTLELNKDGSFIYTPDEGYHGNDSFSYTAYDGEASSNVAVVSIEVICTNTPPVAVDDAFQIDNKSILQGENLLENDNDVDGDTLTAKVISNVEHGTVEILDDGTFTYRPDPGFFGTDSFTYVANDGHEDSNVAVVTIEVSDANDAPFFVYEELSTNPDLEGAIQWKAVDGGNNHWYKLVMDPEQDWEQAQAKAEAMGGYLATLTSAEEDAFVLENLLQPSSQWSSTVGPWLGGFQNTNSPDYSEPAGGWEWVTGEPMEFTNWRPGEPNNTGNEGYMHYDNINTNSPSWNDIPEGRHRVPGFLVEMDQATYQDQYHAGIYRPQELTRIDQPWVGGNNGQNAMVISDHHVITKTSNGNGSAIVWSINDDNTLTKLTEIQSPDSTAASSFGWAINAEGNYLGIGSRFASNQAIHAGRYYVYDVNDFSLKTSFNPSPENAGYFASEGDLSNDVLVVGETGNWGSWNTEAAITAYKVSTTNPSAEQIFREEITSEGTGGSRIAGLTISGDVVIGRFERETEDDWQIIMWNIVRNEDGDPTSLQKVHTMTEAKGVNLLGEGGEELLTNGQYLAAGIPAGTVGDSQPGRVELVRITDSNELVHDRTITAPETADGMKFGESILFDGNLLYVSAPMEDVNQSGTGKVYVYDLNNEASFKHPMMFTGTDLQTGDRFGGELSLAGDRLAISAGEDSLYLFQKARLTNVSNVISIFEFCEIDNPGNSIAEYVEHHIEDLDIDAVEGIAIIGTTHFEDGSWQYSLDNKDNWVTLDDVSDLNALLLRPEDHLRFVPNHQCSDWGSVEYRAWDQTGGTADDYGQYTTINETGDDSPFSDTTAISVVTINLEHHHDENQLTDDHFEIMEDAGTTTLDVLANDELVSGTITNITQSALGSQVAISDDGLTVNYTPAENVYGLETLDYTVTAEDGTNTQATISIDLKPVNDAPTIHGDSKLNLVAQVPHPSASMMVSHDFNADGMDDIAATYWHDQAGLHLIRGAEGHQFTPAEFISLEKQSYNIHHADMNGDSTQDLLVVNHGANKVFVLSNDGKGNFTISDSVSMPGNTSGLTVGDFDNDGDIDAAAGTHHSATWHVLTNDGTGNLSISQSYHVPSVEDLEAGDFNQDGWLDIATTNLNSGKVEIFFNDQHGNFQKQQTLSSGGSYPFHIRSGDFDGDGDRDLIAANQSSHQMTILSNDGSGHFTLADQYELGGAVNRVSIVDWNNDGIDDIVSAATNTLWAISPATGGQLSAALPASATASTTGDFDGNGMLDIAVTSDANGGQLLVFEVNGLNDLVISEDSPEQTVELSGISAGGWETQPIEVTATSSNPDLLQNLQLHSVSDEGLIGHFALNGSTQDATGQNEKGSNHGATPVSDRFGNPNGAYQFATDHIQFDISALPQGSDARTLSLWAKVGVSDGSTDVLAQWGNNESDQAFAIYLDHNEFRGSTYGIENDLSSGVAVDNHWHHIALTLDQGLMTIYVDGILQNSQEVSANTSGNQLILGREVGSLGKPFNGHLDDIKVYNRSLSADEINTLYEGDSGKADLTFTPGPDQYGITTVTVSVEDGGLDNNLTTKDDNLTTTKSFEVTVTPVNDAPTLDPFTNDNSIILAHNGDAIFSTSTNGPVFSEVFDIPDNAGTTYGIDVHQDSGRLFAYSFEGHSPTQLHSVSVDGSGYELHTASLGAIGDALGINQETGEIYVAPHTLVIGQPGSAPGGMQLVSGDGTSVETLSPRPYYVTDIEVDHRHGHVYYSGHQGFTGIRRMDLDGSNDIQITTHAYNGFMALDIDRERIYYTRDIYHDRSQHARSIYQVDLDGSNQELLLENIGPRIQDIDLSGNTLYINRHGAEAGILAYDLETKALSTVSNTSDIEGFASEIAIYKQGGNARLVIPEDSPEQTVSLTNITAGPNESQPLSVLAESDNTGLISEIHVSYDSPGSVGELHFTPAANQHGQATISVTVEDGGLDNDLSTVGDNLTTTETFEVIVTPDNDTPLANNDAYTVWEDSHSNMLDVLSNDTHSSDAGETFLITEIDAANVLGDLEIVADGEQISYTPQPNFSGIETFTYTITDNEGSRATASVSIEVKETNDAPVAVDDAFEVNEDSVNNTLDVLANDHDGGDPGDSIRILDVNHQQVTIAEDGLSLNYTPESDFHGQLEFSYSIVDQGGDTSSANVTLTVNNVGDAPVAIDDHYQFLQTDDIIVLGLTQNDSAGPDANSSIQIIDISNTDSGNDVTIGQDGQSVTYHNYNGISGLDRFTYTIENQDGLRDSATVTLELERVNHDPDARDDYFTITDGTQNQTLDVLANDSTMPDTGEVLTITEVHNDSDSLVEISSDGKTLLFSTLETGDASQKQFTYTISDGNGGVAEANVIVEIDVVIEPPSDDPEAGLQETYSALELDDNGYALLDVLKNERLAPGYFNEPMELVSIEYNGDGSAVINTDQNAILYHPGDDLVTTESITYTFTDSIHSHYQATATIQIAEHSQQDDMVQFMPVIYETGTNNIIHEVDVDQPFDIAVTVQDIRPEILDHYAGVFAAYMDVLYTSEAIELDADSLQYSAQYRNAVSGDLDSLGCIDEVGAMQAGFSPLGTDALELFRITATGIDVGVTEIQTNPADIDLVSDTLVFEPPSALLDTQIDYATATLEILTPDPYGHLDINDDGQVTPIDALHLVNDLNFNGARPLNLDAEMLEAEGEVIGAGHRARHLDVNRDNYISPLDALAIINHLNAPPEMAEGEGPILTDMGLQQDRITRTDNLPETIVATEAIQLQATPEAQRESWSQQVESVFESFELQQIDAEDDLLELISKKD